MSTSKHQLPSTPWSAQSHWKPSWLSLCVLIPSLFLFGVGEGLLVNASLGSAPWAVLAQGISLKTGSNIGWGTLGISIIVMLGWIPLKQKPGLGTILNMTLIALGLGLTVHYLPIPESLTLRLLSIIFAIVLIGVCSSFYLTCKMGSGPRDGLMVGIFQNTGWKIGKIRICIEIIVCFLGWLLGGIIGIGTLLFAFGVGWVIQFCLSLMAKYY
ncbi:YitT family protein [Pelistega sp. NLN82]|uniref:YitT family protein n=1 Tax=Pelistega ratti TaxID=2652177 RepID=A0A6L9Y6L1_9BURK|nr:YitT family protein [Pelistega ratti]NEN75983.1 YitT family protein [Pelistega ratti]